MKSEKSSLESLGEYFEKWIRFSLCLTKQYRTDLDTFIKNKILIKYKILKKNIQDNNSGAVKK